MHSRAHPRAPVLRTRSINEHARALLPVAVTGTALEPLRHATGPDYPPDALREAAANGSRWAESAHRNVVGSDGQQRADWDDLRAANDADEVQLVALPGHDLYAPAMHREWLLPLAVAGARPPPVAPKGSRWREVLAPWELELEGQWRGLWRDRTPLPLSLTRASRTAVRARDAGRVDDVWGW